MSTHPTALNVLQRDHLTMSQVQHILFERLLDPAYGDGTCLLDDRDDVAEFDDIVGTYKDHGVIELKIRIVVHRSMYRTGRQFDIIYTLLFEQTSPAGSFWKKEETFSSTFS